MPTTELKNVDAETVRPLRGEILRPGQPADALVFDGDDAPDTLHVEALLDSVIVAVASVMRDPHPRDPAPGDWRVRGMASAPAVRGGGIGAALLRECEEHARRHGGRRMWCNAREGARAFYARAGWAQEGELFEIPGIGPHYLMSKALRAMP